MPWSTLSRLDSMRSDVGRQASEGSLTRAIDRWIYVGMATWFILIVLGGFLPDSVIRMSAIDAGARPPFPLVSHLHALLMGAFLLLLLAQSTLAAIGQRKYHRQLGLTAVVLAPALVIVGFVLVPTIYHMNLGVFQAAPPAAKAAAQRVLNGNENIMLMQIRAGIVFSVMITIALLSRKTDTGLHKRLMFLAIAPALSAAMVRLTWLPSSMPVSPLSIDAFSLVSILPMLLWDVARTRTVPKAYLIWLAVLAPIEIAVYSLWNTPWWHTTARWLVGA